MFDDLPTDISNNILHRLPVKTLIKCTIWFKSFLALITSHDFISTHLAKYANPNSQLLLRYFTDDKQEMFHFEPDDLSFSGFQTHGLVNPFPCFASSWFTVAGSVNGLLCLIDDFGYMEGTLIILWNPSIRKCLSLPRPKMVFETTGGYESACGFGYDSISDDYKVVRVVDVGPKCKETHAEVYSLKSGVWRVIGVGPSYSIKRCKGYIPCFLNGSVHWVALRFLGMTFGNVMNFENVILKFDMSTESFDIVQLPECVKASNLRGGAILDFYVQECKGLLTLVKRKCFEGIEKCSVWTMKEYGVVSSWTKIFAFDIANLGPCGMPWALGFRKNGEVILVKRNEDISNEVDNVVSMDPVTHSKTILRDIRADCCSFYFSTYVESMVLFKEGKEVEEVSRELKLFKIRAYGSLEEPRRN